MEYVCKQERHRPESRVKKFNGLGKGQCLQHRHEGDRDVTSAEEGPVCKASTVIKTHSSSFRG